jgi:TrmH family RNA methyltransferase
MKSDPVITSTANPTVKLVRSLSQRKNRDENGLFVVEGIHNVGAALEAGWIVSTILYSEDVLVSKFARHLIEEQKLLGNKCLPLQPMLFNSLAEKENPQGILAVVQQRKIQIENLDPEGFTWGAAVISPQDPGNVGTILRTIDCVGAAGLFILDGGVDAYHPACVRASMGSIFWKPVIMASFQEFVIWARSHDYFLIGSSAHARTDYRLISKREGPVILILGNEQKGMDPSQMETCDQVVSLPMKGHASSLNLSVAAGVLLYEMMKRGIGSV